jgi:hypothetical protein
LIASQMIEDADTKGALPLRRVWGRRAWPRWSRQPRAKKATLMDQWYRT